MELFVWLSVVTLWGFLFFVGKSGSAAAAPPCSSAGRRAFRWPRLGGSLESCDFMKIQAKTAQVYISRDEYVDRSGYVLRPRTSWSVSRYENESRVVQ